MYGKGPNYNLQGGVEGIGSIEGYRWEIEEILDDYDVNTIERVLRDEVAVDSDYAEVLRGYLAQRCVDLMEQSLV